MASGHQTGDKPGDEKYAGPNAEEVRCNLQARHFYQLAIGAPTFVQRMEADKAVEDGIVIPEHDSTFSFPAALRLPSASAGVAKVDARCVGFGIRLGPPIST